MSTNPVQSPERQAFAGELRGLLEWAIDALPDGMREVFVLREVERLSTSEAAKCLGVSEDVVKTRLSHGRAHLRRLLMERTGATAPEAFRSCRGSRTREDRRWRPAGRLTILSDRHGRSRGSVRRRVFRERRARNMARSATTAPATEPSSQDKRRIDCERGSSVDHRQHFHACAIRPQLLGHFPEQRCGYAAIRPRLVIRS